MEDVRPNQLLNTVFFTNFLLDIEIEDEIHIGRIGAGPY